ncbi:MAG: zinc dependent phospholipase C family protein [Oscillospiraceae bacterium]|nr:zinc dependent phospholipase C family protein [Oscillospiraceae bacterium]
MKTRGHIYMANLLLQELREQKGFLTLPTVPDDKGKVEYLKHQIPDQIYTAIRNHPGCFRAGAVGPDFFPDMLTGQMSIHPQNSGKWLDMMFEELRRMHPYGDEFEKALAFYMGWLMHYCGDMYGHQYVNLYAYGWFPSIGEMFEHTKALIISPAMKAIMDYLQRHLTEEELNAFYENPDVAALTNLLLDDPAASEELQATIDGLDDDGDTWNEILNVIADVVRVLLLVNSATNILRHLVIEAHLDNTIDENLKKWNKDISDWYALDIPHDFIRRCFTTPDAYERMQKLCGNDPSKPASAIDILGVFVERYEEEYQRLMIENGDLRTLENLELRARYLDKWVSFWLKFVQNDLLYGSPVPLDYRQHMYEEMAELVVGYASADEGDVRLAEHIADIVDTTLGILEGAELILPGIPECIEEWAEMKFEQFLLKLLEPVLRDIREFAEPKLIMMAEFLVKQGFVVHDGPIADMETAIEVILEAFQDVRKLLNCEPLFHVKGLEKSLNEQWARLGTEGRNCFNLECPMMENSLQMGKLCLLGAWELNRLFETNIGPGAPFRASDVRWSLSELVLEVVPLENRFRNHDFTIFHEVVAEGSDGQLHSVHKQTVWSGGKMNRTISAELRLAEPLDADKIAMCRVYFLRNAAGQDARDEYLRCILRLYDKTTGLLLFTAEHRIRNVNGSCYELLPLDREAVTERITEKMENAKRINSLSKLSVRVQTGSDGTDKSVQFEIAGNGGGSTLRGPISLDKNWYNDFESGDLDTYDLSFTRIADMDLVGGFRIKKPSSSGDWRVKHIWVMADNICIGELKLNDVKIESSGFFIPLNREALKAPELELVDEEITRLLVDIHTADKFLAGTDDNVYLSILSNGTVLRELELDESRNDFERDRLDAFSLDLTDSGGIRSTDITSFKLTKKKREGMLYDDAWVVDEVRISNYHGGRLLAHFKATSKDNWHKFEEHDNAMILDCRQTW